MTLVAHFLHDAAARRDRDLPLGRRTPSSTSRNGFVNPALVQPSSGSTSWPHAQLGAGAALRRPRAAARSAVDREQDEHDARRGQRVVPRHLERGRRVRRRVGHGREPASGPASEPGNDSEDDADDREHADGATSAAGLDGLRDPAPPRPPSSTSPTTFTKQSTASAAVAASARERERAREARGDAAVCGHGEQRLQRQPLRREPVQRRQPGDRHRADEERAAGPRHPLQQPAEAVDLERPRPRARTRRRRGTGGLEDGVVERVQERGRERDAGPLRRRRARAAAGTRRGRAR